MNRKQEIILVRERHETLHNELRYVIKVLSLGRSIQYHSIYILVRLTLCVLQKEELPNCIISRLGQSNY